MLADCNRTLQLDCKVRLQSLCCLSVCSLSVTLVFIARITWFHKNLAHCLQVYMLILIIEIELGHSVFGLAYVRTVVKV